MTCLARACGSSAVAVPATWNVPAKLKLEAPVTSSLPPQVMA